MNQIGGRKLQKQFIENMGSSYLLAHGLGEPVKDASTKVMFPRPGFYHLWVSTKDWAPFPVGPGRFKILINGVETAPQFGANGAADWQWFYGGKVESRSGVNLVTIKDLSGFDGRVDAILFTDSENYQPANDLETINQLRRDCLNLPEKAPDAGEYDLVVIGGGMAGICAAN